MGRGSCLAHRLLQIEEACSSFKGFEVSELKYFEATLTLYSNEQVGREVSHGHTEFILDYIVATSGDWKT